MSSDSSSDEDMIVYYYYCKIKKRTRRRFWVHPYIERNIGLKRFDSTNELQKTDEEFLELYRMSKDSYLELKQIIAPAIQKRNTNMRECVSAEERILITLRYLAIGCTFVTLSMYFARGDNTISRIVGETTKIFWDMLKGKYMAIPNSTQWKAIADRYYTLWNIPNCLGAIGGKHIRIDKCAGPKNEHFVILMASCDADGVFTLIEIGNAARNSHVFPASATKHWISNDELDFPPSSKLPNDKNNSEIPYYFVGDETFPLSHRLMKPYAQRYSDDEIKNNFNHRLSAGTKPILKAFQKMVERFQVLNHSLRCRDAGKVTDIIRSVCILHNFVLKMEGLQHDSGEVVENLRMPTAITQPQQHLPDKSPAYALRHYLAEYFIASNKA